MIIFAMKFFLRICGALFVTLILLGIGMLIWQYYSSKIAPFRGVDFNKKEWDEAFNIEDGKKHSEWDYINKSIECKRGPMVYDLKKNYLKNGVSISDVKNLLGEPETIAGTSTPIDITGFIPQGATGFENCLSYFIGNCNGNAMDYDHLFICFDDKQSISKVTMIHSD